MNSVSLKVVSEKTLPEPPYPADTKVKGWKFTIDHERLNQSDTWALSPADMRPWLLMLWTVAWQQMPAGSFSNDDHVIAAKIGMDARLFAANKDILLRGWFRCLDGRLYHPVIVDQVTQMLDCKEKERERKQAYRLKMRGECPTNVPWDRHGKDMGKTTPEPEPEPEPILLPSYEGNCPQKPADQRKNCPHQKIIDLYHQQCPTLPEVRSWEGQRPQHLRARWQKHPDLEWWKGFFEYVAESKFLTGRVQPKGDSSPFFATLEWIIRPTNFQRITEGYYHR